MDQFDLNLLRTFDALWRHRHLGRAAEELGISQPALSHALKRLREQLGDPLFVKSQGGMQPSPRAVELAPVVQSLLGTVREHVLVAPAFDAAVSSRTFTLAMSDIGEVTFLPKLLAQLALLAPGVDVVTVSMTPRELAGALQRSEVDLVLGFFPDLDGTDVFQQRLFSHGFACLVSSNSPVAATPLTAANFVDLPHAVVNTESRTHDIVEQYLRDHGIRRRQLLRCPHFLGIPHVIAATNLVATVSESIAEVLSDNPLLAVKQAPYPFPQYDVKQHWHRCQHEDPGNRWLRGLVVRLFGRPAP
jgi:DNA-binding transcriptional LysR family regulator